MKNLLTLTALLIALTALRTAETQTPPTTDSLLNKLSASRPDTSRYKILQTLTWDYLDLGDAQRGLQYAQRAHQLARRLDDDLILAKSLYSLACAYKDLSRLDTSRHFLNQSIQIAHKLGDQPLLALDYNALGVIYKKQGSWNQALANYQRGLHFAKVANHKTTIINCLTNLGNVSQLKEDYVKATQYHLRALRMAEEGKNSRSIAIINANIGLAYKMQGDHKKTEVYYLRAYRLYKQLQIYTPMAIVLNNLGEIYIKKKDYVKALAYTKESLSIAERMSYPDGTAGALTNLASIYYETDRWQESERTNLRAIKLAEQNSNQENVAVLKINLGLLYSKMRLHSKALTYGKQGFEMAQQLGSNEHMMNGCKALTDTYAAMGNHEQALKHHKQFAQYKDSLLRKANVRKMNELFLQYETGKKEGRIKVLSQQAQIQNLRLQRQRLYLVGSVILVSLLLPFGFLLIRQMTLRNRQKTTELEQKLLLTQLNPHFIFNALTAIQTVVYRNNPVQAGKYLAKFAKLMRLILENSRQQYIPLSREIQTLEYYFALQQLRFEQTFEYRIYLDPLIDPERVAVPPMFAQPLIENSLEHGLLHRHERGLVQVRYLLQGDQILLEVEDDGVGLRQAAQWQQHTSPSYASLATQITRERLAILNRTKNRKVTLDTTELLGVDNLVAGTKATFFIPFKTVL